MTSFYFDPVIRFFWEGSCRDNWHEGPRRIYDCLLEYVAEGSYLLTVEKQPHALGPGSILIVPPGIITQGRLIKNRPVIRHCIHFDWTREFMKLVSPLETPAETPFRTELRHAVPAAIGIHLPLITRVKERPGALPLLQNLLRGLRGKSQQAAYLLWPVLRCLLSEPDGWERTWPAGKTSKIVILLKHYIESQYQKDIGYPEFCGLTKMSESHLCQAFRRLIGVTPGRYLMDIRLDHAKQLIGESTMNVSEAAEAVGMRDANYFTRVFKKRFGIRPTDAMSGGG